MDSTKLNDSDVAFFGYLSIYLTTLLSSTLAISLSIIFIYVILSHRELRQVGNILQVNSSFAILLIAMDTFSIAAFCLYHDVKQRQTHRPVKMESLFLCHLRGYIAHITFCALAYSYVIQALYRLIGTIYYYRIDLQHWKIYMYAIVVQWMFGFAQLTPIAIKNNQAFIEEEYLCQIEISNSRIIGYICFTNYVFPLTIIMIIYSIITRSIREKETNGTYRYNIHRTRRQIVLTRRILILVGIVLVLGGPYSVFIFMELFSLGRAPSYSHRVGFMCISIATALSMITIMHFTRPFKEKFLFLFELNKQSESKDELQLLKFRSTSQANTDRMQHFPSENTGN